jgi:hypothetical protein
LWSVALVGVFPLILGNEDKYAGIIAYFFESAHRNESEADKIMARIFNGTTYRCSYHLEIKGKEK